MLDGYIKLHRKMVDWEWYDDANTVRVFLHLLLLANHEDGSYRGQKVSRGQRIISMSGIAKALNLTKKQVRLSFDKLKKTGEIGHEKGSAFPVVTINNYDTYQVSVENKGTAVGTGRAQGGHREGTYNKNDKNDKNDNNSKEVKPPRKRNTKKPFVPPTIEEFKAYCSEHGFSNIANRAYYGYAEADWHNSKGKKVSNWKKTLQHVWFREDNRDTTEERPLPKIELTKNERKANDDGKRSLQSTLGKIAKLRAWNK